MRGFFAIGVEQVSKSRNLGNLMRSAHAFGASFVFTVNASFKRRELLQADTSATVRSMPWYDFDSVEGILLPRHMVMVAVELTDDAVDLPSFRHPPQAAYVMGPERSSVSPELMARCDHVVKIPTKFCVNVATAGAILMYDRIQSAGYYPPRPVRPGGPVALHGDLRNDHKHGGVFSRKAKAKRAATNDTPEGTPESTPKSTHQG
jgi:tRNA(Leu) C34 or U34 (ribose-2'-O)-methylase TrmL